MNRLIFIIFFVSIKPIYVETPTYIHTQIPTYVNVCMYTIVCVCVCEK